jgi:glycosyltransferase involved in cell wall biosynthesis
MKALLLSISLVGGAGGATYRLHQGLQRLGIVSNVLVKTKFDNDETVIAVPKTQFAKLLDRTVYLGTEKVSRLPFKLSPKRYGVRGFYLQWLPVYDLDAKVKQLDPDVINLHWICNDFLSIETIPKFNKPLVWTLHDMWAFTGGCDYSLDCDRYVNSCGACPQLDSKRDRDLSHWVWQRKVKAWKNLKSTVVTPSSWLAKRVSSSSLFKDLRVEVIPNGLDTNTFKPIDRHLARERLNLPQDRQIVLFGAWHNEYRKGFHLLEPALQSLSKTEWRDKIEVVIFGFSEQIGRSDLGFKTHYLGKLNDPKSLALAYGAADVFVAPSLYDNLPTTVMEAIACGTPCVAFNIGGVPDLIDHQQNGYLARPYEIEDLAKGIAWVLAARDRHQQLSARARAKAEQEFTLELQARRYRDLFEEVSETHRRDLYTTEKVLITR